MSRYRNPPPKKIFSEVVKQIQSETPEQLPAYMDYCVATATNGQYHPFHKFRFMVSKGIEPTLAWHLTREARRRASKSLPGIVSKEGRVCSYVMTPEILAAISMIDRHATDGNMESIDKKIGRLNKLEYLIEDLVKDEAISSSQLEGAATTTIVAKDMLSSERTPKTDGEKMILGNFRMMTFAWRNRGKHLTLDLIKAMHETGVSGIDDDRYTPGFFRQADDVFVENSEHDVVHVPPLAAELNNRLQVLCDWINADQADDAGSADYIHPLIRALSLHFAIGYEHPFRDGNGRVARCLFYWFMFKQGYSAFKYIAISVLLNQAPTQYGRSYLDTETDDMDLTYFFDYQSQVIIRAIIKFNEAWTDNVKVTNEFQSWLLSSGQLGELSRNQSIVLMAAVNRSVPAFTAKNVQNILKCSNNTAMKTLNGLKDLGFFDKFKVERTSVFKLKDLQAIISAPP